MATERYLIAVPPVAFLVKCDTILHVYHCGSLPWKLLRGRTA